MQTSAVTAHRNVPALDGSPLPRGHDWAGTALGHPSTWPDALRTTVDLMSDSRFPMFVAWGHELALAYNDAYVPLLGAAHPSALGKPFGEACPDLWEQVAPLFARALGGEATWCEDLPLSVARHGYPERVWFTFSYSPLRDASGRVAGVFCACTETTQRVVSERLARFRSSLDERLRDLTQPADAAFAGAEALGRHLAAARCAYAQVDPAGWTAAVERDWTRDDLVASLAGESRVLDAIGAELAGDLRAGRAVTVEDCRSDPRCRAVELLAAWGWVNCRSLLMVPIVQDLHLRAVLLVHDDQPRRWTSPELEVAGEVARRLWETMGRVRADNALREGEERLRLALEAGKLGAWDIDLVLGTRLLSERSAQIHGVPAERLTGRDEWLERIHPEDREGVREAFVALVEGRGPYDVVYRALGDDGSVRWVSSRAIAKTGPDGLASRVIGVHADVTDAKREERHRKLLIDELNHRVKNTLATVQSIASQTLRSQAPPNEVRRAIEGRLIALSRAHDVLTRESWDGASLRDIVGQAVESHGSGERTIAVDGPDIRLAPRLALALALCLQELATNATRHGALSVPGGRVDISWDLVPGPGERRFTLRWQEAGGPAVTRPERSGFGIRLIERHLAHEFGEGTTLAFPEAGVVCVVSGFLPEPSDV